MTDMEQADGVRREVLPYVVMLTCTALPPLVLALIGVFGDHSVPPGRCEGLGGGCVLSPANTAKLLFLFVLPMMVLWAAGAMVALALLRRRPAYRARSVIVQGLLPVAPVPLLFLLLLLL
jgi:hypothetical protein